MSRAVRCVSDASGFSALRESWNELVRDEPQTLMGHDALSTFEWFEASVAAFPEGQSARVVVSGEASHIEGILPVVEADGRAGHLQLVTELYGGRNGPLLRRRDPQALSKLLQGLDENFPSWVSLDMTLVGGSEDEILLSAVSRKFGYRAFVIAEHDSPFFQLPDNPVLLEGRIGKDLKARIRSAEKKLSKLPGFEYWSLSCAEDVSHFFDCMLSVEISSWKHTMGTAISCHPQQEYFYKELFPRFAREGMLTAALLKVEGVPISYIFGLVRDGVFSDLKSSMHHGYYEFNPSHLLRYMHMKELIANGVNVYDFMGVVEPHKLRWSSQTMRYTRRTWAIFRPGFKGALIYAIKRSRMQLARLWMRRRPVWAVSS